MPKKTDYELEQLVQAGEIAGFTLDTTEFHHAGYNFKSKILKALGQFAYGMRSGFPWSPRSLPHA
jgi:hypothetical protein